MRVFTDAERSGLLAHFYSEAIASGATGTEARQYAIHRAWLCGELSTAEHDQIAVSPCTVREG